MKREFSIPQCYEPVNIGKLSVLLRTNFLNHFHHTVFNKFPLGERSAAAFSFDSQALVEKTVAGPLKQLPVTSSSSRLRPQLAGRS